MKITDVEAFILESPYENRPPEGSDEAHGVKHCLLLKVSTDEGLVGWSDVETAPHVAAAVVSAPESGAGMFEGVARPGHGRRPVRGRAALGQTLSRHDLLRPPRRGHAGALRVSTSPATI